MELHPYRQAFIARDLDRLLSLLADDVIFHSPMINEPGLEGRDSVAVISAMVLGFLKEDQYTFTHDLGDERAHVFVADRRVGDQPFKTKWLLEFDAEGKIREIWLMVRPLTGLAAFAELIGQVIEDREVHELSK